MKSYKTLLFILSIFLILGIIWLFFPKNNLKINGLEIRFPSYAKAIAPDTTVKIDVDSVLQSIQESFVMTCSESQLDTLNYFRDFLTKNPNRIYLPNNNYQYFDTLFYLLEQNSDTVYRIMHYGDSQIELDRISSVLRQSLQTIFSGSGVGMIPAIQKVPSVSISQKASGNFTRYIIYGDSTTQRAPHSRYGVMGHFSALSGKGTITFSVSNHMYAQEKVKQISRISLLIGNNSPDFKASLQCDTFPSMVKLCDGKEGVSLLSWSFPQNIQKGNLTLEGNADIYALLLDGENGIAVDNNPLRGCSGTIFTKIDKQTMQESFALLNTRLIILQFGGNRMPSITNKASINAYMKQIVRQIDYFKEVAPQAKILFIGPSDMGKSINGVISTYPMLSELNDSLKSTTLRNNVAYWDMFNVMGGENSMIRWVQHQPPFATTDYIHFTHHGAKEIGNVLSKSFETYYNFYHLRKDLPNDSVINFIKSDTIQ